MSNIVIDTSIFIDHLRGNSLYLQQLKEKNVTEGFDLLVPHMVITELFAGEDARKKAMIQEIEEVVERFTIVGFTVASAKKAGELMRKYRQIPDPLDLMIAAIAIEQDAQVATHNKKHFEQIRGLKLYNFKASISSEN